MLEDSPQRQAIKCKYMQIDASSGKSCPVSPRGLGWGIVPCQLFSYPGRRRVQAADNTWAESLSLSTYCVQGPAPATGHTTGSRWTCPARGRRALIKPADEYPFQKLTDDKSEARSEMETAWGREVGDT